MFIVVWSARGDQSGLMDNRFGTNDVVQRDLTLMFKSLLGKTGLSKLKLSEPVGKSVGHFFHASAKGCKDFGVNLANPRFTDVQDLSDFLEGQLFIII